MSIFISSILPIISQVMFVGSILHAFGIQTVSSNRIPFDPRKVSSLHIILGLGMTIAAIGAILRCIGQGILLFKKYYMKEEFTKKDQSNIYWQLLVIQSVMSGFLILFILSSLNASVIGYLMASLIVFLNVGSRIVNKMYPEYVDEPVMKTVIFLINFFINKVYFEANIISDLGLFIISEMLEYLYKFGKDHNYNSVTDQKVGQAASLLAFFNISFLSTFYMKSDFTKDSTAYLHILYVVMTSTIKDFVLGSMFGDFIKKIKGVN